VSKRFKVLYLMRTWVFGGSHTIIFLLLKHLPRDRFDVTCIPFDTPDGGNEVFVKALEDAGYRTPDDRIPWRRRTDWWRARDKVSEFIEKYSADLIHTYDTHSNVLVGVGRKRWPCACVASAHGWWTRVFPLRSHVYEWAERNLALPNFERVLTVSQNMKGKILWGRTAEERIRVIHTGLDIAALEPKRSGDEVRRQFGIPADGCVAGTVSRIFVEKGHTYLLQAAQRLADAFPHLHLLVVGDGPLREPLIDEAAQRGIADRVHFTGFYDDIPSALDAMDVFVQPSILDEGFPTSVLEAQVAGLPVIASDVGGTCETMDVGKTGLLVPPKDTDALTEALRGLVAGGDRRRDMGKAAGEWIRSSFTLEKMVELNCAAYEEAVQEYQRSRTGA